MFKVWTVTDVMNMPRWCVANSESTITHNVIMFLFKMN